MLAFNRKENKAKQRKLEDDKKEAAKRRVYVFSSLILAVYQSLITRAGLKLPHRSF